jgi:hypothetical protein
LPKYQVSRRPAVLDRLLDDGMSVERLRRALARDFHLDLSDGFLYKCLDGKVRQVDLPGYRRWTLEQVSGMLRFDEIHLTEVSSVNWSRSARSRGKSVRLVRCTNTLSPTVD